MTRPLCPYPQTARYKGTGDPNVADKLHLRGTGRGPQVITRSLRTRVTGGAEKTSLAQRPQSTQSDLRENAGCEPEHFHSFDRQPHSPCTR